MNFVTITENALTQSADRLKCNSQFHNVLAKPIFHYRIDFLNSVQFTTKIIDQRWASYEL